VRFLIIALSALIVVNTCISQSNTDSGGVPLQKQGKKTVQAKSIKLPGFSVNVSLSDKAQKRITSGQETIIVFCEITGEPKQNIDKRYEELLGGLGLTLANVESEKTTAGIFQLPESSIPKKLLQQVKNDDFLLLVNVASGRKSSKDNLLDCGIYQGSLKAAQNKTVEIKCKLIYE
jgi:hypothetical protein